MVTLPGEYGYGVYGGGYYGIGAGLGDYPLTFDTFERTSISFVTDIFEHEDGTEKRLNVTPLPTQVFAGTHRALINAERDILQDFFDGKTATLTDFEFEDPTNGNTYDVRFADEELVFKRQTHTLWQVNVKLKEVLV